MMYKKGGMIILMGMITLLLVGCNSIVPKAEAPTIKVVTAEPAMPEELDRDQPIKIEEENLEPAIPDIDDVVDTLLDLSSIEILGNGTEPFWNFSASGSTLVFNEPSMAGPMDTTTETITMSQNLLGTIINVDGSTIDIIVTQGVCNDGMSDATYTHSAIMTRGSDVWNGCANITP